MLIQRGSLRCVFGGWGRGLYLCEYAGMPLVYIEPGRESMAHLFS